MKRAACLTFVLCAFGQTARDAYRAAYREWRVADPSLERDAASSSAELETRASKEAAGVAQYGTARAAFLQQMAAEETQKLAWLETAPDAPSAMILDSASTVIAAEGKSVKRTIATFADDPDPGIRELRTMLARENAAIDGLTAAIEKRKLAAELVKTSNTAVAELQVKASGLALVVEADSKQALDQSDQETAAWAQYYALLGKAASSASAPGPVTPAPAAPITPLPLIRYTGTWAFPASGGLYHGPQPESFEMTVNEENGHASGTLVARFKLPPGSNGDPEVKFEFSGEFQNTRNQVFKLTASDGASGTIELIPGSTFNLIEVNFETDPKPRKIHQGNVVLLKQ
jgi:hypothetical protein